MAVGGIPLPPLQQPIVDEIEKGASIPHQQWFQAVDTALLNIGLLVTNTLGLGAAYTLVLSDAGKQIETGAVVANTVTVPPHSAVPFPVGTRIGVTQLGPGTFTIAAGVGVTLLTFTGLVSPGQFAVKFMYQTAIDSWVVYG